MPANTVVSAVEAPGWRKPAEAPRSAASPARATVASGIRDRGSAGGAGGVLRLAGRDVAGDER